jgi:hypothetical protein
MINLEVDFSSEPVISVEVAKTLFAHAAIRMNSSI